MLIFVSEYDQYYMQLPKPWNHQSFSTCWIWRLSLLNKNLTDAQLSSPTKQRLSVTDGEMSCFLFHEAPEPALVLPGALWICLPKKCCFN